MLIMLINYVQFKGFCRFIDWGLIELYKFSKNEDTN